MSKDHRHFVISKNHQPDPVGQALNGHDPYPYLKDVLERLPTQRASAIDELLPNIWRPRA
jgi:hypothetical protein